MKIKFPCFLMVALLAGGPAVMEAWAKPPAEPRIPQQGLSLWLRADAGVKANGDGEVSEWKDQSPQANDAETFSLPDMNHPLLKSGGWNGHPLIHFDGASLMTTDRPATTGQEYSLFIVCQIKGSVGPVYTGDSGSTGWGLDRQNNTEVYAVMHGGVIEAPMGNPPNPSDPQLLSVVGGKGVTRLYASGESMGEMNNDMRPPNHTTYVGGLSPASPYFCGDIAEIIVYNRRLSNGERIRTERYLADKYGIYHPNASWIEAFSPEVQDAIYAHEWSRARAEKYLKIEASHPAVPPAGLCLWLSADSGVETTKNNEVITWSDQSSGGNEAFLAPLPGRPHLEKDAYRGHSVIRFDGDSYLQTKSLVATGQAFTIFEVATLDRGGSFYNGDAGASGWGWAGVGDPGTFGMLYGGQGWNYFNVPKGSPTMRLVSATRVSGNARYFVAGTEAGQGYLQMAPPTKTTFVGAADPDHRFAGQIAEIIVYDCSLDEKQRQQVEAYLEKKYGLNAEAKARPVADEIVKPTKPKPEPKPQVPAPAPPQSTPAFNDPRVD